MRGGCADMRPDGGSYGRLGVHGYRPMAIAIAIEALPSAIRVR